MNNKNKDFRTLAIVGNGFDLAHGYKTGYDSFTYETKSKSLDTFKSLCEDEESITTWYDFENNIRILTGKLFHQNFADNCNLDANRQQVQHLLKTFQDIHNQLTEYLEKTISSKPIKIKETIQRYIDSNTIALNFNYTSTFEHYTKNVIYVHGSLKEKDILLGYDYRDEPCLASYYDVYWSKDVCRENLAFRRFLRSDKVSIDTSKYIHLKDNFEKFQKYTKSNRGLDNEAIKEISSYEEIESIYKQIQANIYPDIDYSKINIIVVLGHGIEADIVYLERLLKKCKNLEKIVIFRYDGESDTSFSIKSSFFKRFCKNTQEAYY